MVVFLDSTGPDTKISADRGGERSSSLQPQHYGGALDRILSPTHAVERKLSYSGHVAFANLAGIWRVLEDLSISRRNDAPLRIYSYPNGGTSKKFFCGSKNFFHLVMHCGYRFCIYPKGHEG